MIDRKLPGTESIRILHRDTRRQPTPRTTTALRTELLYLINARGTALHRFICGYLTLALWTSTDDTGTPPDSNHSIDDISTGSLLSTLAECSRFMREHATDLPHSSDMSGQNFWLTRNGYGEQYWHECATSDETLAAMQRLIEASHAFGMVDLSIGDDEKFHFSNEHLITSEFTE